MTRLQLSDVGYGFITILGCLQIVSSAIIPEVPHFADAPDMNSFDLAGAAAHPRLSPSFQPHKPGTWSVQDRLAHHDLVRKIVADVDKQPPKALSPALQELKDFIESDARIYMYFDQMFDEIPWQSPFWKDPIGAPTIRDYTHFLNVFNHIITTAPDWPVSETGIIAAGLPIIDIFDWPMATQSGYAAFLDPGVNKVLKKVLQQWGKFLASSNSSYILNEEDNGWFGPVGKKHLENASNAPRNTSLGLCELYHCDPSKEHYGFTSWDDFFTRKFREGIRPLDSPEDDSVITAACEATPSNVQTNVKLRDQFFIKGQPYSVGDMLNHNPLAEKFVGGTVYQGYLSSLAYHRWHALVSGTIRRATVVDGTYFSLPTFETIVGTNDTKLNDFRIDFITGYLSSLATRGIVIIEADNKDIGLVALIVIGMDEVSTCQITASEGQHVQKGEEMGMFHFGGSIHALLFQDGVELEGFPSLNRTINVPVLGKLAQVKRKAQ